MMDTVIDYMRSLIGDPPVYSSSGGYYNYGEMIEYAGAVCLVVVGVVAIVKCIFALFKVLTR